MEMGSVALVTPEEVLREESFFAGRKPSAALWEPLAELLTDVAQLSAIVVATGPGSYNGVRIAISAAQGIALVHRCPAVGLSSFAGVAPTTPTALAIGDARRGAFSLQSLANGKMDQEVQLVSQSELEAAIEDAARRGEDVFCFEPVERFPLSPALQQKVVRRQSQAGLLGAAFWNLAESERRALESQPLEPIYLRPPHITKSKRRSLLDVHR